MTCLSYPAMSQGDNSMFECFDCTTGKTLGYKNTKEDAERFCERGQRYGYIWDYIPTKKVLNNE